MAVIKYTLKNMTSLSKGRGINPCRSFSVCRTKTFVHLEFQTFCNNLLAYTKGVFIHKVDNNNASNYLTQLFVHCLKQAYPSLVCPFRTLCLKISNFVSLFLASVVICRKTFPRLAFRPTRTDLFAVWILESSIGIPVFP